MALPKVPLQSWRSLRAAPTEVVGLGLLPRRLARVEVAVSIAFILKELSQELTSTIPVFILS